MSKKLYSFFILLTAFLWLGTGTMWGAQSLPYSYGFEDYPFVGWTQVNTSGKNNSKFIQNGTSKKTGSYGIQFSSYTDQGENTQYLISPELNAPTGVNVSFYFKNSNSGKEELFKVGYSTTDAEIASFTFGDAISKSNAAWEEYANSFPAGTKYIAVYYYSTYQYYLYVDDFTFEAPASCVAPTAVIATQNTPVKATLSWTKAEGKDNYQYLYVAKNGTPDWTGITAQNTNSVELDGLTAGTEYDFYVRTYCDESDQSTEVKKTFSVTCPAPTYPSTPVTAKTATTATLAWNAVAGMTKYQYVCVAKGATPSWTSPSETTGTSADLTGLTAYTEYDFYVRSWYSATSISDPVKTTFRTECAAVNAPHTWDFETATTDAVPGCWDNSGSASTTATGSNSYYVWGVYSYSGNKFLRMYNSMVKSGTALINSPSIVLPASPAQDLVFDYSHRASCGNFTVKISTDGGTTFSDLQSYDRTAANSTYDPGTFTEATISLAAYANQTIILQFYAVADYDAGAIFVDNVKLQNAASCPKPTGLGYSEKAAHSVKLSWTSTASAWKVEYSENSDFSTSTTKSTTDNPYTLSGLEASTHYYVRVKADCGGDGESNPSNVVDFTTDCDPVAIGWSEDFDGASALPDCWKADSYGSGNGQWYMYSNAARFNARVSSSTHVDLITPPISLADDAILVFSHSGTSVNVEVYADAGEGEVLLKSIPKKEQNDTCDLSAYKNKTVKVIFRAYGYSAYSTTYFYLNDAKVVYKPVALPTDLAAAATADGANVTWNSAEGTSWNLQYREKDAEPEAAWISVNGLTATSHTLTGLSTEKTYEVQVQSVCSANRKSDWTASATFSPESCPTVTAVSLSNKLYNSVTVNCSLSGAGTWDLEFKIGEGSWTPAYTNITTTTQAFAVSVGNSYSFRAKPSCSADAWVAAGETYAPAYGVPAPSVSGETEIQATVAWEAVYGATAYQYLVVAKDADHSDWSGATNTDDLSATLPGLTGGSNYDVWVRSNYSGNYSDAAKATFTTTKVAPTALTKTASTTESISFSWSYAGAVNQFQWKTSKAGSEWSAVQSASSAEATGLEAGTAYTIYVRTYYADGIYSNELSGTLETDCATKNLPVQENFASGLPTCWETNSSKWSTGYFGGDGSECMAFDAKGHSNIGTMTTMGIVIPAGIKAEMTFKYRNIYGSSNTLIASQVNILDNNDNVLDNTSNVLSKSASAGTTAKIDLADYAGQTIKLQFQVTGAGSVSGTAKFYIDDVDIHEKPCAQLADDLEAVPTPDGATITWSQGEDETQYQYCVVDAGEEPVWAAAGILEDGVRTVTITGKTFGNTYDCYVRSYCSATMQSEPRMVQFTPSCVAPSALAVSDITDNSASLSWTSNAKALRYKAAGEDWTNVTIDPIAASHDLSGLAASTTYTVQVQAFCAADESEYWSDEFAFTTKCGLQDAATLPLSEDFSTGVKPACWEFISDTEYPDISSEKIWFQGENEQIVVLPGFDIELNALSLTFDFTASFASIELGYLTTIGGAFNSLGAVTSGVETDLATTSAPASAGYLAIRYFNTTSEYATGSVDNVVLRKTPSCLAPTAVAATPGVGSAEISWTAGSETAWNLQYKLASAASWTDAEGTITNPFVLSGLEQGVSYKVRVQAACAGEELSDWSDEVEFTTNCEDVAALPFIETFDAALSNCWDITDEETATYAHSVYGSELRLPGGKAASGHLVKLPNITASLTNATMTIEYKATTGSGTAVPQVGYIDDLGDFQQLVALEKSNTTTEARVELASVDGKRLALRYDDGTSEGNFDIAEIRILDQLTLADGVDNTATLAALNGQTVDVTIGRTFVCADYFNTICLPFSLSAEELAASPIASNDLWAFKYARVESGELLIRIVEAENINAGEPYLISWPAGDNIENPLFKNVTISASVGKVMGDDDLKFVGTLKPETFAANHDDSKLFLYQNNTLYWWDGTYESALKSFRAFFTVEGGAGEMPIKNLPARIIKEEQETTGIDNTGVDAQALKFLENNQVVIIRNGVKYNIQGQVIEK